MVNRVEEFWREEARKDRDWMAGAKKRYRAFLDGETWRQLRELKLKDSPFCERCGVKENLQVHHRHYGRQWGTERLGDLETLCGRCHRKRHPSKRKLKSRRLGKRERQQMKTSKRARWDTPDKA